MTDERTNPKPTNQLDLMPDPKVVKAIQANMLAVALSATQALEGLRKAAPGIMASMAMVL